MSALGPSYGQWWKVSPARQRRRVVYALLPAAALLVWATYPYLSGTRLDKDLFKAVERDDTRSFQTLLQRGASISARNIDGTTVLHWAAEYDRRDLVSLVIEQGVDVNAVDRHGVGALHQAARQHDAGLVSLLLDHGANPNLNSARYGAPLGWAVQAGDLDSAGVLLDAGAVPDSRDGQGWTPLQIAVARGDYLMAKLLLAHGAEPNATGGTRRPLLQEAVIRNSLALTASLLAHGANVDARDSKGNTALHHAARLGYLRVAVLLLAHGADVNAPTRGLSVTPLHLAVKQGHLSIVRLLLNAGASVNAVSKLYGTPLHWAAEADDPGAAALLLAHGARPGVRDSYGLTPAQRARHRGFNDLADLLRAGNRDLAETAGPGRPSYDAWASGPHQACSFPPFMHRASRIFLDDYIQGNLSLKEFRRRFSLPNSDYLQIGACVVSLYDEQGAGD
jgi:ankyrin repeat protein